MSVPVTLGLDANVTSHRLHLHLRPRVHMCERTHVCPGCVLTKEHQRRNREEGWPKICDVPRPIRAVLNMYKAFPGDVWHGRWCKKECPGDEPVTVSDMDAAELP
eukprot:COSAG03_NODE_8671_length_780_cov_1.747801_1_plen_105_part_00